ncbi:ABC transporter ATP-binding protein [Fournierella massiliensis]|nr:ABC transporter ATP-binding protein [Fournierella massiliensis]MCF2558004.1 ABC transporter ATP-binding protein [Fournierella massiliensis]
MAYIEFSRVVKEYAAGGQALRALDEASFTVEKGELAVILGASGAGKTTALNILGGMDTATSGRVVVDGRQVTGCTPRQLVEYRRRDIGFVFQFYNLVPNLTALENVELAAQICPDSLDAAATLAKVGLAGRMDHFPAQLSGGEQQRVAIARALAKNPKLLLCDEPTGALDYATGKQILQLLQDTCRREGVTVLIITHNSALAPMADRVIRFRSGRVTEITQNSAPLPIAQIEW